MPLFSQGQVLFDHTFPAHWLETCVSVWYSVECCFSSVWGERKEEKSFIQKPTNHLTEFSTCLFSFNLFCTKVSKPGIFHLLSVIYNFTRLFFIAVFSLYFFPLPVLLSTSFSRFPSHVPFISLPPSSHSYIHLCPWGSCSVLIWWVEMSALWGGQRWEQPDSLWSCWAALASETDWRADYNDVAKGLSWLCLKWLNTRLPASQDLLTSFVSLSFFFFTELPPGWEKIDDPVYGVYYVE